jgi:hypothetical protein
MDVQDCLEEETWIYIYACVLECRAAEMKYLCPTEVFVPSRPFELTGVKYGKSKNVLAYSCCAVLCVVLVVMCIYVIYKFLGLGL